MINIQTILVLCCAVFLGAVIAVAGGILGAYAVFRTKHAIDDIPFIRKTAKDNHTPAVSYVSDLFQEEVEEDNGLSEAARRVHEQKEKQDAMDFVKGNK